jgi:hypothetical protein
MVTERSPRQIRLLTALLLFGTFLFGAVAGAGFSHWNHMPPPPQRPRAPFLPGPLGALKLTPEQEPKALAITERYRPQLDDILRASFPKVRAIIEQMEQELRKILTQEQIKFLDEMKARRPMVPGEPMPPGAGPMPPDDHGFMPPLGGGPPPWAPGLAPPPQPPFGGLPGPPKQIPQPENP